MDLLIYVLHGAWHPQDTDGAEIFGVSEEPGALFRELDRIAGMIAGGCVEMRGHAREEHGERCYEAIDGDRRYAKSCLMEHCLHISGRAFGKATLKWWTGKRMTCRRCGSKVRLERDAELWKEYPYYCPQCDENMYSFECMEMRLRDRWRIQCRKWAAEMRKR